MKTVEAWVDGSFNKINNYYGWALSEMIQFIYRSAIRDNKPIYCYIPSSRMRNLLKDYIKNF